MERSINRVFSFVRSAGPEFNMESHEFVFFLKD